YRPLRANRSERRGVPLLDVREIAQHDVEPLERQRLLRLDPRRAERGGAVPDLDAVEPERKEPSDMLGPVHARAELRVLVALALDEVEDRVPHHELAHELAVEQRAPLERDVHERKREERLGVRSDLE